MSSIYLVGFPSTQSPGEPSIAPADVCPTDWIYLVRHLVPEARVFEFVLFGDGAAVIDTRPPSPGPSPYINYGSDSREEEGSLKDNSEGDSRTPRKPTSEDGSGAAKEHWENKRSCSAQGLENEARLLLEAAQERQSANKEVLIAS